MDKKETLFWKAIKKETQSLGIYWHRIENIANSGTPDLLGTHNSIGYFTLELKITSNNVDEPIINGYIKNIIYRRLDNKGKYIKKVSLSSTMGPAFKLSGDYQ